MNTSEFFRCAQERHRKQPRGQFLEQIYNLILLILFIVDFI